MTSAIDQSGLNFAAEISGEALSYYADSNNSPYRQFFNLDYISGFIEIAFEFVKEFYGKTAKEWPGILMLSAGVEGARNYKAIGMNGQRISNVAFIDETIRVQINATVEDFMKDPAQFRILLLKEIAYGFDLDLSGA